MSSKDQAPFRSTRHPRIEALDAYLADKPSLRTELLEGAYDWRDYRMGPRSETYEITHGPKAGVGVAYRDRGHLLIVHVVNGRVPTIMATRSDGNGTNLSSTVHDALVRGRSDTVKVADAISGSLDVMAWREAFGRLPDERNIDHLRRVPASRAGRVLWSLVDMEILGDEVYSESDLPIMSGMLHSDRHRIIDHLARGLPQHRLDALADRFAHGPMSFGHAAHLVILATSRNEADAAVAFADMMRPTLSSRAASVMAQLMRMATEAVRPPVTRTA